MAIIKCKECGMEISDKAKVCPYCGFSEKRMPTCKTVNLCLVSGMLLVLASVVAFWLITATRICGPKEFMPCLIADILCAVIALVLIPLSFKRRQDIKNKTGECCFSWWSVVLLTIGICLIAIGVCCTSLFDYGGFGVIGLCASVLSGAIVFVVGVLIMQGIKYPSKALWGIVCALIVATPISYYIDYLQGQESDARRLAEAKQNETEHCATKRTAASLNWQYSSTFDKLYETENRKAELESVLSDMKITVSDIDLLGNGHYTSVIDLLWIKQYGTLSGSMAIGIKFPCDEHWTKLKLDGKGKTFGVIDTYKPEDLINGFKTYKEFRILLADNEFEFKAEQPLKW